MSTISILKKTPTSISFKINNKKENYEVALVNGIRRVIIANLETYCFSRASIDFQANSSIYNEDFLSQRFSLIPLNFLELEKLEVDKIEGHFDESNEDPVEIKKYFASDIKLYYGDLDKDLSERKLLDINKIITHPGVLLLELKPTQKVKLTINIMKGTHKEHGSMFCPVSKALYFFEMDEKALNEKLKEIEPEKREDYSVLNKEKFYLKTASGLPQIYNFLLECDDMIPVNQLFTRGCDCLIGKLKAYVEDIKNVETSENLVIETSPTNMVGYDFIFENSDDTLGNLLQTYGLKEKDIHYIGYSILHPLDKKLFVRVSLVKPDVPRSDYEKKIINILVKIIDILEQIKKDYLSALK